MLGKNEVPNHAEIQSYLRDGGQDLDPHKVAWCAAFVSASLQKAGLPVPTQVVKDSAFGPGAYAPNYLSYGSAVDPKGIQAGDILVANDGHHVGFAEGPMRNGPNGPEVQLLAGNERDASGQYAPGSYTSPTGSVANRAQVGMVGERWVPLSQYSARRYQPPDTQDGPSATAAAPSQPQPSGTTITSTPLNPQGRDAIIRTVAAEADHPGGDAAVAAVIRNRLLSGQWGTTPESVVKAPGQFSAWNAVTGYGGGAGANTLVNISPDSSTYKQIGGVVDDVFSGKTPDPTKGALNFYAPGGMPGGKAPGWWSQVSNPIRIGAQWYGTAPGENARVTGGSAPAPLPAPGAQARPFTPTPTQASGPIDPSIIARGGYSPPIPTTPGTTINSTPASQIAGLGQLAGNLKKALGVSDDDKDQKPPDIKPDIPPAPGARNISPLLGNPQLYAQRMAGLNQPITWGGASPGQNPWAGYGPQNQPVYGTSLMSQLQMLSDPAWMNQMAGG